MLANELPTRIIILRVFKPSTDALYLFGLGRVDWTSGNYSRGSIAVGQLYLVRAANSWRLKNNTQRVLSQLFRKSFLDTTRLYYDVSCLRTRTFLSSYASHSSTRGLFSFGSWTVPTGGVNRRWLARTKTNITTTVVLNVGDITYTDVQRGGELVCRSVGGGELVLSGRVV